MRKLLFLLVSIGLMAFTLDTKEITWKDLANVSFEVKEDTNTGDLYYYPSFGLEVLQLEGLEVSIEGYMIPIDVETDLYMLSANPFAACFFCGQAGPETVITIQFKDKPRFYNTDDVVRIKGIFKTNSTDVNYTNYILSEAVEL